ncbi:MAG TPA: hypothetical protein VG274_11955 [Rhizomicrobium sp.]|jgi:hypothetical protein|nr:hypothetical protein [Rhizomicrobium sp.]
MRAWIAYAATGAVLLGSPAMANDGTGKGHSGSGPVALSAAQPDFESQQIGRVVAVDPAGMTLKCHWVAEEWTYHVTPKTTFRKNGARTSLADLKSDDVVQVLFHREGTNQVADAVIVSTQ